MVNGPGSRGQLGEINMDKTLVIVDFDQTLVDAHSDLVVLSLRPAIERRLRERAIAGQSGCWAGAMQEGFRSLHESGVTPEIIRDRLKEMVLLPHMKEALQFLKTLPFVDVIMMSEANQVFVEVSLAHHGLSDVFKRVITNPAHFNEEGVLTTKYYCEGGHDCDMYCPEDLCKSLALDQFREENKAEGIHYGKVVYVGDGRGDFCPCLKRLTEDDVAMPRFGYSLLDMLSGEYGSSRRKCQMVTWKNGEDLLKYFQTLKPAAAE